MPPSLNRAQRRAAGAYLSTSSFRHAREIDVELSTGKVRYELPDLTAAIAFRKIENPMLPRLLKGVDEADLDPDELVEYLMLQCEVIASHLRQPNLVEDVGLEKAREIVLVQMRPDDRAILWGHSVNHREREDLEALMSTFRGLADAGDVGASNGAADGKAPE